MSKNKNVAFTICAKNYIGLAQVLEKSLKKYNENLDFYIFVVDEFIEVDETLIYDFSEFPTNIIISKDVLNYSLEKWNEMSFKYNLTEFCTSIKANCFKFLFEEKKYENAIFFDPDILIFNSLDCIFDNLKSYSIILTPHVLDINTVSVKKNDNDMLNTGVFNLGFIALKNDEASSKLLNWWNVRLSDSCYVDYCNGYFTDQKWMDLIPGYFNKGELLISDNLGMNVAIWNFDERKLEIKDNVFYISNRNKGNDLFPLLFVHYSGFDYSKLILGEIYHTTVRNFKLFEDLLPLFKLYENDLRESSFNSYLRMKYSYGHFENSTPILNIHRRLYRRLIIDEKIISNPFKTDDRSFFSILKENKMIVNQSSSVDRSNRFNTSNIEEKVKIINNFLKLLYKLLGHKKYFILIKVFREYSKIENHVHLIDKTYTKNNVFID